jgi:hypothetical protein
MLIMRIVKISIMLTGSSVIRNFEMGRLGFLSKFIVPYGLHGEDRSPKAGRCITSTAGLPITVWRISSLCLASVTGFSTIRRELSA